MRGPVGQFRTAARHVADGEDVPCRSAALRIDADAVGVSLDARRLKDEAVDARLASRRDEQDVAVDFLFACDAVHAVGIGFDIAEGGARDDAHAKRGEGFETERAGLVVALGQARVLLLDERDGGAELPPPRISRLFGSDSSARNPSESTMRGDSGRKAGRTAALPVAITALSKPMVRICPVLSVTMSAWGEAKEARPCTTSTFLAARTWRTPVRRRDTTAARLRSTAP